MSDEKAKSVEAAAPSDAPKDAPKVEAAATEKIITEVIDTQQQQMQQKFEGCVAKGGPDLPKGDILNALTANRLNEKLGGDCTATDTVANLHKKLGPASDQQQVRVETRPDGSRVETRFENDKLATKIETNPDGSLVESKYGPDGRIVSERSVRGDSATLRMWDEKGNVTTVTEQGIGEKKVQMWTFPDGDNLRIQADGTFNGTINGRAVEGKNQAEIAAYIREALSDQSFVPDVSKDSFATDLKGSSMIASGDTRTAAIISKSGDLNIFTADESGVPQRNIATFAGDTMTLHGPNGALAEIKGQLGPDGKYTFFHNGITYTVQNDSIQGMRSMKGNVEQVVTKGPNGWHNEAIERPVDESGNPLATNRVVITFNDKGELQSQVLNGDKPLQTTIITPDSRITYKGDGTDRSPDNVLMRATNNSVESPEVSRSGSMVYDSTGRFSDQDRSEARVYNGGVPTSLTKSQLLQIASFTSAMANQVASFTNYFESVSVGDNSAMPSIESKLGQIQAFMGYVNCNVNGSRFLGLLPMANKALETGCAARDRAGIVPPDQVALDSGFSDPGLVARTGSDVSHSPSLALINGGKFYAEAEALKGLPALQLFKNKQA